MMFYQLSIFSYYDLRIGESCRWLVLQDFLKQILEADLPARGGSLFAAQFGKFPQKLLLLRIQIDWYLDYSFNNLVPTPVSPQVGNALFFESEDGTILGSPRNLELLCAVESRHLNCCSQS